MMLALKIFDTGRTIVFVEDHARRQGMKPQLEPITMAGDDIKNPFTGAVALAPTGGKRRVAQTFEVGPSRHPRIRVT